jgi:tetratricopeptide (TPR) repeat protein
MRRFWVFLALIFLGTGSAQAEWREASSAHFVVYANQSETEVRRITERLERYHNAVSAKLKLTDFPVSPSNRVTIYVLSDIGKLQKLYGGKDRQVAGFYTPRAGGSVAFIPEVDVTGKLPDFSEVILLHEYAHHLMFSSSARNYPLWYGEGFAEFFASAGFEKDGSVWLGRSAGHRWAEIMYGADVPIPLLIDSLAYTKQKKRNEADNFYGRSWLLFHYLTYSKERSGQVTQYLQLLEQGQSEVMAAKTAFGDLNKLDSELRKYERQTMMAANQLSGSFLTPGPINIRELRVGEAAMMPMRIRSKRGVDEEQAKILLAEVQKVSAKFADDPAVLAALAEAEHDAGNHAQAIAAADRAITLNPNEINAYLQKGLAMAAMANENEAPEKAWVDVRKHFIKMNKVENDHPLALKYFYTSYKEQGKAPNANAVKGLEWALELAPFDADLRWMVANQYMEDKRFADAIKTVKPLAHDPHKSGYSDEALELMKQAEGSLASSNASGTKKDSAK